MKTALHASFHKYGDVPRAPMDRALARRDDEYCWPEAMARRSNTASVDATATECQRIYGMRH